MQIVDWDVAAEDNKGGMALALMPGAWRVIVPAHHCCASADYRSQVDLITVRIQPYENCPEDPSVI